MLQAVILGIVGGFIGVIPFIVARRRIKNRLKKDGTGSIIAGMAATLISFVVMAVEIILCALLARESLLAFAISVIVVFLLVMGVYVATLMRK